MRASDEARGTIVPPDIVREHAYHIWEREGRPDGRALDHWVSAESVLLTPPSPPVRSAPRTSEQRAAPARAAKTPKTTAKKKQKR